MAYKKTIFTPEVLAQLPQMIADGMSAKQIADSLGCSEGTVAVRCSQHHISLRRANAPRKQREPKLNPHGLEKFGIKLANIQIKVEVADQTLALIAMRAEQKGMTVEAVASRVLEAVARDNLYDAVIDDGP